MIAGREIVFRRYGAELPGVPLVFLHEGLGSVELWRDLPIEVVTKTRQPGLSYSRYGNGWSQRLSGPRRADYMHVEALETLPHVVDSLNGPPLLIGHSDGASIALIYAGAGHEVKGLVLIAPHVFVEAETLTSIRVLRDEFSGSEILDKMAKYHRDPAGTFYGWADVWLSGEFQHWDIQEYLGAVRCPVLVIQGEDDQYGTVDQLDAIDAHLPRPADRLILGSAGHSPHLSCPEVVTETIVRFVERVVG